MKKAATYFYHYAMSTLFCFAICISHAYAQNVSQRLKTAFSTFENDPQLKFAISSLYVIDAESGALVFEKNGFVGLAPASTQKVITSVSAFELLGKPFRYQTRFAINPACSSLVITPSGDPTFGSERWESTRPSSIKQKLIAFLQPNVKNINTILVNHSDWEQQSIPDGWIWQDVANYYGAGAAPFNWRENQFDILLQSGKQIGSAVNIVGTSPGLYDYQLQSQVKSAATGTGDNAYVYFPVDGSKNATITGTIPVNENQFVISGSLPDGLKQFAGELNNALQEQQLISQPYILTTGEATLCDTLATTTTYTLSSPPLDSVIYWFNKKSINLYGEALVKTISHEKYGYGSTDSGISIIKTFWKNKGLDVLELNMVDGSGLSPLNRVTTHAQVEVLRYAKKQDWFSSFYQSLPEYNGMKMKSGTIRNVKGFCGYHRSASGKEYVFSFLVNNYNGSASALVRKMYRVLDQLK